MLWGCFRPLRVFTVLDTIYFTFPEERFIVRNGCEKIDRPHFKNTCRGLEQLIRRYELQTPLQKNRVKKPKQEGQKAYAGFWTLLCCGWVSSQVPSRRQSDASKSWLSYVQWLGTEEQVPLLPFQDCLVCKDKEQPWAHICLPVKCNIQEMHLPLSDTCCAFTRGADVSVPCLSGIHCSQ